MKKVGNNNFPCKFHINYTGRLMRYLKSRDEQFWEGQILGQSDRRAKSHLEVGSPQKNCCIESN